MGKDHIIVSFVLTKLGACLVRAREHTSALDSFEDALEIREKCNTNDDDLEAADIFFNMGIIYCERKKFNDSLDFYEKAIQIRRELLGDDNIDVAQVCHVIYPHLYYILVVLTCLIRFSTD